MTDSMTTLRYFQVRGKVQNVMFRQTVIRAMIKRGVRGGATNDKVDKGLVHMTLVETSDNATEIQELMERIGDGQALNDWGAKATSVVEVDRKRGKSLTSHQVTTANVDTKQWNPNCTMYI